MSGTNGNGHNGNGASNGPTGDGPPQLFPLGRLLITPGALAEMENPGATMRKLIRRHVAGDWSEMDPEDRAENEFSVDKPLRVFSAYTVDGVKYWVITEADRSATTILLPSEY